MRRSPILVVAAVLVVVGCSGDDAATAPAPATTTPATTTPATPATTTTTTAPATTTTTTGAVTTTEAPPATEPSPTGTAPDDPVDGPVDGPVDDGSGRYPTQPADVPWPTDAWEVGDPPDAVDADAIDAAIDVAFGAADEAASVRAVVVVHGGRIVHERYHPLSPPDTVFDSFSVAKSVTATLAGMAVADGLVELETPTGLAEWAADERSRITLEHLLHMASGLEWTESYAPGDDPIEMLASARFADVPIAKPLVAEPGSQFNYSTGTSAIITEMIARALGGPERLEEYIRTRLIEPLGMDAVDVLTDDTGLFVGGLGFDATTRDFARFGLLHLRGGVWDGDRLLDEAWIDRSRTPSPAADAFGLHWWVDAERDAFAARGLFGQLVVVVPALDLVVAVNTAPGGDAGTVTEVILDEFAAVS